MTVELKITKRSFKNERGEQQTYYSYTAEMFDEVIVFKPKDEDKKFCAITWTNWIYQLRAKIRLKMRW